MRYTIHVALVYVCVDIDIHVTVVPLFWSVHEKCTEGYRFVNQGRSLRLVN